MAMTTIPSTIDDEAIVEEISLDKYEIGIYNKKTH
jgi:hypothetical protein